ncbi:MAG: hypothetical protein WCJ37_02135 [Syntrophus sp. (in: bacteria)]
MTLLSLLSKTEPSTEAPPSLPLPTDQSSECLDDIFADRKDGELAPWEMTLTEWKENHIFIPVREGHGKSGNAQSGMRNVQTTTDEGFSSLWQIAHEVVATGQTEVGVTTIMSQILQLYDKKAGLNLFRLPNRKTLIMHDRDLPATVLTHHKCVVRQAIIEGKSVSAKVLMSYPDLQEREKVAPWQITRSDYADSMLFKGAADELPNDIHCLPRKHMAELPIGKVALDHYDSVKKALAEGKNVPSIVLDGYPDLQPPMVIDEETYLTQNGASRQDIGDCALHKNIPEGNIRKRLIEAQARKDRALVEKRATLREEYRSKIAAGEIRPSSRIEKLIATANGHPDNEAVQAARRLLLRHRHQLPKTLPKGRENNE